MALIDGKDFGVAFICRNRSGYEGCSFLIEGGELDSVTQKSNRFDELAPKARRLPIVSFNNGGIINAKEIRKDVFIIEYRFWNRINKRSAVAVAKWFIKNGLKFDHISYNVDELTVYKATFEPSPGEIAESELRKSI